MPTGSPEPGHSSACVAIANSSLSNAVRAIHKAKGRLRFALYSGRIVRHQFIPLGRILAALHEVTASNPALQACVGISEPSKPSEQQASDGEPYISIDEDHAFAAEIAFLPSLETALTWTARRYDQFASIGPQSNARFLLALIKGQGLMISIMASHVLIDGQSLHLFWRLLSDELSKHSPVEMSGLQSESDGRLNTREYNPTHHEHQATRLSIVDQRYWKWVAQQIKHRSSGGMSIPFQKSCRAYEFGATSRFKREYDAFSSKKYTQYENFVAFFISLVFENTDVSCVHVQCPVTLQRDNARKSLGYHLDSRPIFIDREDYLLGETQALIRSSLKRLMSLEIPWRDYVMEEYGVNAEDLRASPGVLISKFFADDEFELQVDSQPTQPVSEYDLRKHLNTRYTIKVGQRALTDLSANFSYQIAPEHILVLSNIQFIHDYE